MYLSLTMDYGFIAFSFITACFSVNLIFVVYCDAHVLRIWGTVASDDVM